MRAVLGALLTGRLELATVVLRSANLPQAGIEDLLVLLRKKKPADAQPQPRTASQHALVGDLLAYFRERRSAVRPYLSVGLGVVRLETTDAGQSRAGNATPPPTSPPATRPPAPGGGGH